LKGSLNDDIHLGFWINSSYGAVHGATLTLDRGGGGLLIAFLALYVGASSRGIWKLTRCFFHFACSSRSRIDGTHVQRQAVLRNTSLPLETALECLEIFWAWRKKAAKIDGRPLMLALLALASGLGFTLAGIFSSRVSSELANEVLISGKHCDVDLAGSSVLDDVAGWEHISPFLNQKSAEHLAYAQKCYQKSEITPSDECRLLSASALPYRFDGNASCPYSEDICKSPFGNLLIDAGPLDSLTHLGINKGPRFTAHIKEHCAPLATDHFTKTYTDSNRRNVSFKSYHFSDGEQDSTFEVEINATTSNSGREGDYEVYPLTEIRNKNLSYSKPFIPQLQLRGARTTLLFLMAKQIFYLNETADPWFAATRRFDNGSALIAPDEPGAVLGCATERKYCNPKLPASVGCVNAFSNTLEQDFSKAWPDARDRMRLRAMSMIVHQFGSSDLAPFFTAKSVPNLLARQTLMPSALLVDYPTIQTRSLPSNQWQREIEYITQANLAALQHFIVDYARGLWLGGELCDFSPCQRLCYSQKIRSSAHYSFSVLGLSIILAVGGFIVLLATLLDRILAALFRLDKLRTSHVWSYAYAEWQANSVLQLQRMAHENVGSGTWSRATDAIPVTQPGETLAVLDVTDRKHPR
ncbi:hypothetical protein FB567DRAFT_400442, partial [Paraphoma chrysanthemicola]